MVQRKMKAQKEGTDHWLEKHLKPSGTNILIQTLLNTKSYLTNFEKLSSLLGANTRGLYYNLKYH
jgi:hypothetical protein